MDRKMHSEYSSNTNNSILDIKTFKYRWAILLIFGLVSIINFMQLLQFSIIANIVTRFYNVQSSWVDLTCVIFFVSYILLFYPISFFIEKFNLKVTVIVATGLTLAGNVLKIFTSSKDRFWLVMLAQFIIAIGQVQICSLPSKLATTWFGPEQVSTACAIVVLGMQLGSALGCVQSPFIVTSSDDDGVRKELFNMFLYQAVVTGCIFLLVLAFFRSKPPLPPSHSQLNLIVNSDASSSFISNMKEIGKNKHFWIITFSLGLANGVWNSFGVLINTLYINYFPNGESDAGLIALIAIISGGCIGSMFFGVILDKTHHFKRVSFGILALSALTFILVVVSLLEKSRLWTFVTIPIFGFFIAPVLIVGFEYLVEVTYPIPEECSSSAFNAAYYFLSIIATLLFEGLFDAIGYIWTFVVIFFILSFCAIFILLLSSNLKRRDANLQHSGNGQNGQNLNSGTNNSLSNGT